jgi:hypothetical protein
LFDIHHYFLVSLQSAFNNPKRSPLANDYDKILKENIATVFLPLAAKYLGIRIVRSEELKDKLQTTIEKETDFIRIVETDGGEKFILHLEFQSVDEEGMIYRMQEYYGLLRRKYRLPVRQFVIYLGQKASAMQTQLAPEEVFTGFTLQSLRDYDYQSLLASDVPEEIILAVLSNFRKKAGRSAQGHPGQACGNQRGGNYPAKIHPAAIGFGPIT